MVVASSIPVGISQEAAQFIEEKGLHQPFRRMLGHIPVHFRGVKSMKVVLDICHDDSCGPGVVIEVTRSDSGLADDESDWEWRKWEIANLEPDELEQLLVLSYYPQRDNAR